MSLGTVTSTMDEARRRLLHGTGRPPFWVLAERQTAGRGRQGRAWQSPPGNLYATGVFATRRPLAELSSLALVAGLAVAETAGAMLCRPERLALKWPNDVLVAERKFAGILCESERIGAETLVLVGIGVNLAEAPAGVELPATSLAGEGIAPPSPADFLDSLAARFAALRAVWEEEGFAALKPRYERIMWARSRTVAVVDETADGARLAGRLAGIDADGALLLETEDGLRRVVSGRLRPVEGPPAAGAPVEG